MASSSLRLSLDNTTIFSTHNNDIQIGIIGNHAIPADHQLWDDKDGVLFDGDIDAFMKARAKFVKERIFNNSSNVFTEARSNYTGPVPSPVKLKPVGKDEMGTTIFFNFNKTDLNRRSSLIPNNNKEPKTKEPKTKGPKTKDKSEIKERDFLFNPRY